MKTTEFKVGQKVWLAVTARSFGLNREVTVTGIGRRWGYIDERKYRFELATGLIDGEGYGSPGRIYADKASFEAEAAKNTAWRDLRRKIDRSYDPPHHLSAEKIHELGRLLLGHAYDSTEE